MPSDNFYSYLFYIFIICAVIFSFYISFSQNPDPTESFNYPYPKKIINKKKIIDNYRKLDKSLLEITDDYDMDKINTHYDTYDTFYRNSNDFNQEVDRLNLLKANGIKLTRPMKAHDLFIQTITGNIPK